VLAEVLVCWIRCHSYLLTPSCVSVQDGVYLGVASPRMLPTSLMSFRPSRASMCGEMSGFMVPQATARSWCTWSP
jgi:hypothetical protein